MLFGELSKSDKLTLGGEAIGNMSSIPSFLRPVKYRSPVLKANLLEDVCAKQEHLIPVTKIRYFSPIRAVLKKLKYFLEPAIFTEVWNLAL